MPYHLTSEVIEYSLLNSADKLKIYVLALALVGTIS